ncbi:NmrA family NAD(P)-binding protein [Escherichia coli]
MNQTVAVTGATGFIGKYIIDNLLARGFHVRALTRTARAHVNDTSPGARFAGRYSFTSELVAGASVVVHCAGKCAGTKKRFSPAVTLTAACA